MTDTTATHRPASNLRPARSDVLDAIHRLGCPQRRHKAVRLAWFLDPSEGPRGPVAGPTAVALVELARP